MQWEWWCDWKSESLSTIMPLKSKNRIMKCCERKVKVWIKESKKIAHTTLSAHTWVWNDTGIENPWKTMLQNMSRVCVRYVRKVLRNPEQCWSHSCVLDPRQQQIEDQVWAAFKHTEHTVLEHTRLTHVYSAESIYVGRLRARFVQQDP